MQNSNKERMGKCGIEELGNRMFSRALRHKSIEGYSRCDIGLTAVFLLCLDGG